MPSYSEPEAYKAKLKQWSEAEYRLRIATEASPRPSEVELMAMKNRCDCLWAELCQMKGRLLPRDEGGEEP